MVLQAPGELLARRKANRAAQERLHAALGSTRTRHVAKYHIGRMRWGTGKRVDSLTADRSIWSVVFGVFSCGQASNIGAVSAAVSRMLEASSQKAHAPCVLVQQTRIWGTD